jgi:5-methylcytosine-specific restriction endonuclease McrA
VTLTRKTPLKRKPRKRRAPGVGCQGRTARTICPRDAVTTVAGFRFCAKHAADRLTADYVKAREPMCRNCGSMGPLDWAHVFSRRHLSIRWDLANSMALCRTCHTFFTNKPAEWEQWCRDHGIDWDMLRWAALHEPPMDPVAVIERLTAPALSLEREE